MGSSEFLKQWRLGGIESRMQRWSERRGWLRCGLEARMCDLCDELEYQIEKCRRLERATTDELMREAVAALITSYEEDKAKLHPNQ
jgi:hypothetical protein